MWLCPLYAVYTAEEERLSAQLAAVEMLKSGTTTFLEAGTIRFLDEVIDGLVEVGIRGRVGNWIWDLPPEPDVYKQDTDAAIDKMQQQLVDYASVANDRLGTWSILVGHTTASDPLWRAARELADEHGTGMSFHMSPAKLDPGRLRCGVRPAPDDPPRRVGNLARRRGDDALRADRRPRARRDGRTWCQRRSLPDDGTEGELRGHPGRQVPRDDADGHQRQHRHRRQQRIQLLRPDAGHVPGRRAVQGCSAGSTDVPGRDGLSRWPPSAAPRPCRCRTRSAR